MSGPNRRVVLAGGAGLVGQNLLALLAGRSDLNLVVVDKHRANLGLMKTLHPDVFALCEDLAEPGAWQQQVREADVVVMLQAQIGGNDPVQFERNNLQSTRCVLQAMRSGTQLIHVSSSVVQSAADDDYTRSKKQQEQMVLDHGKPATVLRPTLMFGWFDRKHLGWLSRFMRRVPVFPIPGHGRYLRQPLFAGDFCRIIGSVMDQGGPVGVYDISGHEKIDYIDMIRLMKRTIGSRTWVLRIPYDLFHALLSIWALFDRDPPFTVAQLEALCAAEEFELIDWPGLFAVEPTPLARAFALTFNDPYYSHIELKF